MAIDWRSPSSVQLVVFDLNEIAADAYRHRIRPALKKGGNGVYDRSNGGFPYDLPEKFSRNRRARFEVTDIGPDVLRLRATSLDDPSCCVTASVDPRGRLLEIVVPGTYRESDMRAAPVPRPAPSFRPQAPSGSPAFFYGDE